MTKSPSSNITTLDFNPPGFAGIGAQINDILDAGALRREREEHRNYLGASSIGSECLRKVQFDWQRETVNPARKQRIFDRGHASEEKMADAFWRSGFSIERSTAATEFTAANNQFRGHCDGIMQYGPKVEGLVFPCLWEHKCLGASGWRRIEKYGLQVAYPHYYDQVQIYMAYLDLADNDALFTAENADTCHLLALLIPFDAEVAQAASDRAVSVVRAVAAGELMPRITDKGPDFWVCKMCSHKEFCWREEIAA